MKIIKYVFLLILLAFIALAVFVATQEGKYDIKEERIINVPQPLLYEYINDYRNWDNVGILTNNDTTAVFKYSEATSGKGAITTWTHNGTKGKIQTLSVKPNDSILQRAVIDEQPSEIIWSFKNVPGGTKVTVNVKGQLGFTDKANAVFKGEITGNLKERIKKGLNNLNNFLIHELKTYSIEEKGIINKLGTFYLCQTVTSSIPEMNRRVTETLPKLMAFIKENKIATNGNAFSLYKTYDQQNNTTTFSVCVPIKDEIFTSPGSDIEGGELLPFKAYKTTLKGYYSYLPQAWKKAHDAVAEKGLGENTSGQYIEVYTRNVKHSKKPSQWITDIYIPIGSVTVPINETEGEGEGEGEEQAATSGNITGGNAPNRLKPLVASPLNKNVTPVKPSTVTLPATGRTTTSTKPAGATATPQTTTKPKPKPRPTTTPANNTPVDEFN